MDLDLNEYLVELRHQLHALAEVGLELPRTQERVLQALEDVTSGDLRVELGTSCSSITAVMDGGRPGPAVLLRADMDALPLAERLDLPFRSRNPETMHACGHDLHMAMLVGAAHLLCARRDDLAGSVVFMFQPGEEGFGGCDRMIDEGVLDVAGRHPVAAYALHVMSAVWPTGVFATRSGALMAAADGVYVTVRGVGGHGSAPHLARDPIVPACEMVGALQMAISREISPFNQAVVNVGQFHAGTRGNIIPETATFEITVRTLDEVVRERILESVSRICHHVGEAHRVLAEVVSEREFSLTINDASEASFASKVIDEVYGASRRLPLQDPIMGSEDFSSILKVVPGAMIFLGACPPKLDHARAAYNHSPEAMFDDRVVADGSNLYAELARRRLALA